MGPRLEQREENCWFPRYKSALWWPESTPAIRRAQSSGPGWVGRTHAGRCLRWRGDGHLGVFRGEEGSCRIKIFYKNPPISNPICKSWTIHQRIHRSNGKTEGRLSVPLVQSGAASTLDITPSGPLGPSASSEKSTEQILSLLLGGVGTRTRHSKFSSPTTRAPRPWTLLHQRQGQKHTWVPAEF